jgi:hypothetical protein
VIYCIAAISTGTYAVTAWHISPAPLLPPPSLLLLLLLRSVLLVDLNSLGVLKPLPYLVMFAMSNVGGWMGDALILRGKQSVASARKTVNTIGEACPNQYRCWESVQSPV